MDQVVLVDELDAELGTMEKMQAHVEGRLHRAISVFVYNSKGEMLLQQRASDKYHSAGLWTNTCCSHPRPGEEVMNAAHRRLHEEMGMQCELKEIFSFVYKAHLDHGLTEYEYDHVFSGMTDTAPVPNPEEAGAWKYISMDELIKDIAISPDRYTEWFKICLRDMKEKMAL